MVAGKRRGMGWWRRRPVLNVGKTSVALEGWVTDRRAKALAADLDALSMAGICVLLGLGLAEFLWHFSRSAGALCSAADVPNVLQSPFAYSNLWPGDFVGGAHYAGDRPPELEERFLSVVVS